MTLPFRRLLNLIYEQWVRDLTPEGRAELDAALDNAADAYADRPVVPHGPQQAAVAEHVPGLAPRNIPAPSWWKGDRGAWRSSVQAARDLDEPAAALAALPAIGSG